MKIDEAFGSPRLAEIIAGAKYHARPIADAISNITVCTIPPGTRRLVVSGNVTVAHLFAPVVTDVE